jgi:hypothetical protein
MNKKLKNYNHKLAVLTLINLIIYFYLINRNFLTSVFVQDETNVISAGVKFIDKSGIFFVASIIVFFLNYIFSSDFKYILVFKKMKNPLPGNRVFTELLHEDSRINLEKVNNKYNKLPNKPKRQNEKWYEIYKRNQNTNMVFQSHRDFLYARDATSLVFSFLCIYSILTIIGLISANNIFLIILILEYFIISHVASARGKRFVLNVIAEDIH